VGYDTALTILGGLGLVIAVGFGIWKLKQAGVTQQKLTQERAARESAEAMLRAGTDAPRDRDDLAARLRERGL
jgi:hypothetical protein